MRERPVHRGSLVAVLLCTALASISAGGSAGMRRTGAGWPSGQLAAASAPGAPVGRGHPLEACRPSIA